MRDRDDGRVGVPLRGLREPEATVAQQVEHPQGPHGVRRDHRNRLAGLAGLAGREGGRDLTEPPDGVPGVKFRAGEHQRQRVAKPVVLLVTEEVAGRREQPVPRDVQQAAQVVAA